MADAVAFLGSIFGAVCFAFGYFLARHYMWDDKINQLVRILEVKTTEKARIKI